MIINIHSTVGKNSIPYFEYMQENYLKMSIMKNINLTESR